MNKRFLIMVFYVEAFCEEMVRRRLDELSDWRTIIRDLRHNQTEWCLITIWNETSSFAIKEKSSESTNDAMKGFDRLSIREFFYRINVFTRSKSLCWQWNQRSVNAPIIVDFYHLSHRLNVNKCPSLLKLSLEYLESNTKIQLCLYKIRISPKWKCTVMDEYYGTHWVHSNQKYDLRNEGKKQEQQKII